LDAELADARAAKLRQISADVERGAEIARDRADVRSAPAIDAHAQQRPVVIEQLDVVDLDRSRFELHLVAAPRQVIRAASADLHRAVGGGTLLDRADESLQRLFDS